MKKSEYFDEEKQQDMTINTLMKNLDKIRMESQSFLSPSVHNRVCVLISSNQASEEVLTSEGILDWLKLDEVLDFMGSDNTGNYDLMIPKLGQCMNYVCSQYSAIPTISFKDKFSKYLKWTHNEELFLHAFELLHEEKPISKILACLLLTACIERSLGNVYLSKKDGLPSLLKDLLVTPELEGCFDKDAMSLLCVLMGTPSALNLRNILWHGFVSPTELHKKFGFFLIAVAASLGKKLEVLGITSAEIPSRAYVSVEELTELGDTFSDFSAEQMLSLKDVLPHCTPMLNSMIVYWEEAIHLYTVGRYGDSLTLLVPLLENILRLIFVCVNNQPQNVATAEPEAHYITLTEIFSENLSDGSKNLFNSVLSRKEMELLHDVLVYPEGPRIRDRLSHGELEFPKIPRNVVKHLLCISVVVASLNSSVLKEDTFVSVLKNDVDTYESLYHPYAILKKKISKFLVSLRGWNSCPTHIPEVSGEVENSLCLESATYCILRLCKAHRHFDALERWSSLDDGLDQCQKLLSSFKISTYHQPKICLELTTLLRHVLKNCTESSENVKTALKLNYNRWKEKSLRSRQRATYERLLMSLPALYSSMRVMLVFVMCYLYEINDLGQRTKKQVDECFRFLKMVLKFVEKLNAMTSFSKNKWQEAACSAKSFLNTIADFEFKFLCV